MTALAQGTAGLALVMCFGLLGARQVPLARSCSRSKAWPSRSPPSPSTSR